VNLKEGGIALDKNTQKNPLNGKKIALFIVYAIVAVLLLITVLSFNDLPSIIEQLKTVNYTYVALAVLMVAIYLALYPLSLCILAKARKVKASTGSTYCIAMTEHFFNGITPWATGGQPFQAHSFTKVNVKLSESTGLLLANLVIYMIATNGLSLFGLFFLDTLTSSIDSWWLPIIAAGYTINFSILAIMIILGRSKTVRGWLVRFVRFVCKFKALRKFESKADELEEYFVQVQDAFADLLKQKKHFFFALLTKILAHVFYYGASYFILMSFGVPVDPSHLFLIVTGTSFALTAVGFFPTPGASGGVEGSTGQVFKSIILYIAGGASVSAVVATANGVMLIWRLLSYYFIMLVSILFYIGLEVYFAKRNKINKKV
jgi:uncharacterized protein (TIRG00374 family)